MKNTRILEENHDLSCMGRRTGQPDNKKKTPLKPRFLEMILTDGVWAIVLEETTDNKKNGVAGIPRQPKNTIILE